MLGGPILPINVVYRGKLDILFLMIVSVTQAWAHLSAKASQWKSQYVPSQFPSWFHSRPSGTFAHISNRSPLRTDLLPIEEGKAGINVVL